MKNFLYDYTPEMVEMTKKLVSFPTVSPEGNESLCKTYLTKKMRELCENISYFEKKPNRTNIVGKIGESGKSLIIACHMDVALPGPDWKTPPFKPTEKNNKIYGRGALDDKGPFAISYYAVKDFVKRHPKFKGVIYLVALADEEAENVYGVKYLISKGLNADAGLIPDGGYFSQIDIGEVGCVQIKIHSFGKQEHTALSKHPQNAILHLTKLTNNIKDANFSKKFDKRFSKTTVNVSKFHGGELINAIPGYACAQFDIRFGYGIQSKEIIKIIKNCISDADGKFKLEIVYTTEPHIVKDYYIVDTFLRAGEKQKIRIKPIILQGNSVAKEFNEAGIPSIAHYPMEVIPAHEPNEYIDIASMLKTQKLYVAFLEEYFKVNNISQ